MFNSKHQGTKGPSESQSLVLMFCPLFAPTGDPRIHAGTATRPQRQDERKSSPKRNHAPKPLVTESAINHSPNTKCGEAGE